MEQRTRSGPTHRIDALARQVLQSGGLVLRGPEGGGKSWNWTQLLDRLARGDGRVVHRFAGSETSRSIPLGAFAPLLPGSANADLGEAQLISIVSAALVGDGSRRTVLGIDDADLLDDVSATVVGQLVRSGDVVLVATQTAAVVTAWIDSLARLDRVTFSTIEPLEVEDVDALAEARLGGPVRLRLAADVHHLSMGNPARVRSILDGSRDADRIAMVDGLWQLSGPSMSLTVTAEVAAGFDATMADLGVPERELLEVVAMVEQAPFDLLEHLDGSGALESLERAGLVNTVVDRSRSTTRLADPLLSLHLRTLVPFASRRRIATSVSAWYDRVGMRRAGDASSCALASLLVGAPVSIETSIVAAEEALRRNEAGIAQSICEAALSREANFELHLLLAQALFARGRPRDAALQLDVVSARAGDADQRVEVALRRGALEAFGFGRPDRAYDAIEAGRGDATSDRESGRLDLARAQVDLLVGRAGRAHGLLAAISDAAVAAFDHDDWTEHRLALATASLRTGRYDEALEIVDGALDALPGVGEPDRLALERLAILRVEVLLPLGRLDRAGEVVEAAVPGRTEIERHVALARWRLVQSDLRLLRGDITGALDACDSAMRLIREDGGRDVRSRILAHAALVRCQAGDGDGARHYLDRLEGIAAPVDLETRVAIARALAWSKARAGDKSTATALLLAMGSQARDAGELHFAATIFHDLIRLDATADMADELQSLVSTMTDGMPRMFAMYARGRVARDADVLDDVVGRLHRAGALVFAAEAARTLAEVHHDDGDREQGRRAHARADALLHSSPGARTPAAAGADSPLTPRQHEVAALAWSHSNSEIAERLCISVRTVENHLHTVFQTLGIHSRSELSGLFERPARRSGAAVSRRVGSPQSRIE